MLAIAEEAVRQYAPDAPDDATGVVDLRERTPLSDIRTQHRDTLVAVYGTVTASPIRSVPVEAAWECQRWGRYNSWSRESCPGRMSSAGY